MPRQYSDTLSFISSNSDHLTLQWHRNSHHAFVLLLVKFMDTHGFYVTDSAWEHPAEPKHGGRKVDTDNLVLLRNGMKENNDLLGDTAVVSLFR